MILVVGATGLLGTEICLRLRSAGEPVRGVVRTTSKQEKADALRSAGVETVVADLKDLASLKRACQGASAVITTASSTFSRQEGDSIETVDRLGCLNLIEAAHRSGVDRFVYTSIPPDLKYDSPLVACKREVEKAVVASGMQYTVLLANYFMEVWLSPALGFDYAAGNATVYGTGDQPQAWISYRDVAGFAADSIHNSASANRMLLIGGPENLSPNDVIRIFEDVTRKKFNVKYVPDQVLQDQYSGAPDPLSKSFAGLMLEYSLGAPMNMTETLRILPRRLTSLREYAEQVVSAS